MDLTEKSIVVVKFSAIWCGPCKTLNPVFEKMKDDFTEISFQNVDVDESPAIAKKYSIRSVPTVIFFREGKEMSRIVGSVTATVLRTALKEHEKERAA